MTSGSPFKPIPMSFPLVPFILEHIFAFQHAKMFQSNLEHSLPLTWNQPFLQKAFLIEESDRNQDLNIKTSQTIFQVVNPNGRKQRRTKEPFDEGEKAGLNLSIQKAKIMASGPITLWQ